MILVTGATGTVGGALVDQLLRGKDSFRVMVRDPAKAAHLRGKTEIVQGDLDKPESLDAAVRGADHVFLLTNDQDTASDTNLIRAAKAAGVRHVVKLSTNFVDNDPPTPIGRWHGEKERLLRESGLGWTMLRPGGFMSNCLRWAQGIKAQGSVSIATGESRTAPIDPADIAAVARLALTRPGHEGKTYELTGVDVLSGREQVETLAKALGRPIQVVDVSVEQAVEGMRRGGRMPPKLLEAQGEMLEAIRSGRLARKTTDTVRELTGSAAGSFAAWCERHKGAFL